MPVWARVSLLLGALLHAGPAAPTVLPPGFVETQVADDLISPTAVAIAPDGRIFVAEQSGRVRIIKNGVPLVTPFLQLSADASGERGLLGIAFSPTFSSDQRFYAYYAVAGLGRYRLSAFTADGDVALPGETILLELPPYTFSPFHFGGGIRFGLDGTLFLSVGDHLRGAEAPRLNSLFGKILRIRSDGSIPEDNPFYGVASGVHRSIWARGLRNPFNFDIHPRTGRMFIDDVGQAEWEEINEGFAGADYGWPATEGPTDDPAYVSPVYAYSHFGTFPDVGCATTGAAFYAPESPVFPAQYHDGYFFADFCGHYVRYLDAATDRPTNFAFGLPGDVTDVDVGPDGSVYVLVRASVGDRQDDDGVLYRLSYTASQAPQITAHPESQTVLAGDPVTFSGAALAADSYQWQRDGADVPGATETSLTLAAVALADDGAELRLVATNEFGSTASRAAVLEVTTNRAPTAAITVEGPHALYHAGDLIQFSGEAEDPEDGPLPASAFTWRVDFHHGAHSHPFVPPTSGVAAGAFTASVTGETAPDVWYRIHLGVEDSEGRGGASYVDVLPELATLSLATEPSGLPLTLDDQPRSTPYAVSGVVGLTRRLGASDPLEHGGQSYRFAGWSDGGARQHAISLPGGETTYTAYFTVVTTTLPATTVIATTSTTTTATTSTTTTTTTSTTTTTTTLPPLGPLVFHAARRERGVPFRAFGPIELADRHGVATYDVLRPRRLGFPAAAPGSDAATHLVAYELRAAQEAPAAPESLAVRPGPACAPLRLAAERASRVLVPASQSPDGPVAFPDPAAHGADHFLCRRVRGGSVASLRLQLDVADPLRAGRYDLERITAVCEPAALAGEPKILAGPNAGAAQPLVPAPVREPARRLLCYEASRARRAFAQGGCGALDPGGAGEPLPPAVTPEPRRGLHVHDSFGPTRLDTRARAEICVPAFESPGESAW